MESRHLGKSDLQVSVLGLGTNNFGGRTEAAASARVIRKAIDAGINFLDTSNVYADGRSEEIIGNALVGHRHRVALATKVGYPVGPDADEGGASRDKILQQVELSLKRLRTDYIDLYQIHLPDSATPIEETLRALDDLIQQGKVRYIGCSNFSAWQTCEAVWTSHTLNLASFVSIQLEYSLLVRDIEREVIPFCRSHQIGIIPFYPLAGGLLTGKYRAGKPLPEGTRFANVSRFKKRFLTEGNLALVARLEQFAMDRGHTIGELTIAWLLDNPLVCSVITGATKPEQVEANVKGTDWRLTRQEMEEIGVMFAKYAEDRGNAMISTGDFLAEGLDTRRKVRQGSLPPDFRV